MCEGNCFDLDFGRFMTCVIHIQCVVRRKIAYKKADRLRRQKQRAADRRQNIMKLGTDSMDRSEDFTGWRCTGVWLVAWGASPGNMVLHKSKPMGFANQDALLLMRAAGMKSSGVGEAVNSIGTQSTSLGEDMPKPSAQVMRSIQRPEEEFEESQLASVDPATAAAAAAADPNASADVIMGSVSAHTQIAQTVAAMPQAHLQLCLGTMQDTAGTSAQELAKAAPERARATLLEHPQLCYALLHAQFLLGLSLEPVLPPDGSETQQLRAEAVQRENASVHGRKEMQFLLN
eukprot:g12137.t1